MKKTSKKLMAIIFSFVLAFSTATAVKAFSRSSNNSWDNDSYIGEATTATAAIIDYHVCPRCSNIFSNESQYNLHLIICTPDDISDAIIYICGYCGATFKNRTEFVAHTAGCSDSTYDASGDKTNSCPWCNTAFGSEAKFNNHIQACAKGPSTYSCDYCKSEFKTETALSSHMTVCSSKPADPYVCPYCDMEFDYCGKIFTAVYQFNAHASSCSERKRIVELKINSLPSKTSYEYKSADSPDLSGLSLKAVHRDGTSEIITDTDKMEISGFSTDTVGTKNVSVSYGGNTTYFSIEVNYTWWQWLIRIFLLGFLWY